MLQGEHRLDKADNAGRRFQVTNIGLDRADKQWVCPVVTKDGTQRAQFNRVPQWGAGAVRFDVTHRVGGDMGSGEGLAQQFFLGTLVGHG